MPLYNPLTGCKIQSGGATHQKLLCMGIRPAYQRGGAVPKPPCPEGYITLPTIRRKAYTTKSGTSVKATTVRARCSPGSGRARGRKHGGPFRGTKPWVRPERAGKLGGPGYLSKSDAQRHQHLDNCIRQWGYRSCLGSIMVLERSRAIKDKYGAKLLKDREYLKQTYGGPGSYGPRSR